MIRSVVEVQELALSSQTGVWELSPKAHVTGLEPAYLVN